MNFMSAMINSKPYRFVIMGSFWTSIIVIILVLLMIFNFVFKITVLDYRFDDGELQPPIENIRN